MKTRHVLLLAAALLAASLFAGVGAPLLAHGDDPPPGTAAAAMAQNNDVAARLIAALKAAGVAAKDIQTQYVSLSPRYNDSGDDIVGYTAQNTVGAVVRNLTRVGAVIDAAVAAGANNVNGPALSRDDTDALYKQALKLAVADARGKAEAIGEAGRFSVGKISIVVEGSSAPVPVGARDAAPGATPIEPGTQDVTANVTVTFLIS